MHGVQFVICMNITCIFNEYYLICVVLHQTDSRDTFVIVVCVVAAVSARRLHFVFIVGAVAV